MVKYLDMYFLTPLTLYCCGLVLVIELTTYVCIYYCLGVY